MSIGSPKKEFQNMSLRYAFSPATGTADTLVAGSVIAGNTVEVNDGQRQKAFALSALVTVDCETNTMTMSGRWSVSNDGSTWVTVTNGPQNAAAVVLATGTAGADAAVTKAFEAPDAVYGWRKARFEIVTGVVTGNTVDTYSISYSLRSVH
jgi:hypothetical protein